jgi:hypothetical protein
MNEKLNSTGKGESALGSKSPRLDFVLTPHNTVNST